MGVDQANRLDEILQDSRLLNTYINLVCDFLFTLGLLYMMYRYLSKRNGSEWPVNMLVQIALLLLTQILFDVRNVFMVKNSLTYADLNSTIAAKILDELGFFSFLGQNWYFSSQYLRVAFHLYFSLPAIKNIRPQNSDKRSYKRTNLLITVLEISVLIILLSSFLSAFLMDSNPTRELVKECVWTLLVIATALINLFAMRYIHKCTEQMHIPGVKANVRLRYWFVGFFCLGAFFALGAFATMLWSRSFSVESAESMKVTITDVAFRSAENVSFCGAHMIMLVIFLKFTQRLDLAYERSIEESMSINSSQF